MARPTITTVGVLWLLVWLGSLYAALELHRLPSFIGHSICGPWGCAATPEALLGYHVFWTLLIVPIAWGVARFANVRPKLMWPVSLLAAGLCSLLGLAYFAGTNWLTTEGDPQYLWQRILFVVATTVDLPAAQLIIGGVVAWFTSTRRVVIHQDETCGD